jgi:hypothetical protein
METDLSGATRILRILAVILFFVFIFVAFYLGMQYQVLKMQANKGVFVAAELAERRKNALTQEQKKSFDYLNATYSVDGNSVTLLNGRAEEEVVVGSAIKKVTVVWGETNWVDLNGDGKEDVVFLLTQNMGGSGTFYYVVVALGGENHKIVGTNAILLGDRIAPQNINIENGIIMVNYAERRKDEPMAATPSVGATKYLVVINGTLKELKN